MARLEEILRTLLCFAAILAIGVAGCQTGDDPALFNVTATLNSSNCGAAIVTSATEALQIRLTETDTTVTWESVDTGDVIQGSLSGNTFTLAKIDVIQVTPVSGADPGCSVRRHDSYSGTLTKSSGTVTKFAAEVDANYSAATGFSCDSLIGATGGFSDLPCDIKYSLVSTAK